MRAKTTLALPLLAVALFLVATATAAAQDADKDFKFAWLLMSEQQDYETAARKFAQFLQGNPRHPKAAQALSYMGICYSNLKKHGAAAQSYERLLAEYPQAEAKLRREAMLNGGHANVYLKRYERAIRLYSRLLKEFPTARGAQSALFWRGECHAQLARLARAKKRDASTEFDLARADFDAYVKRYPESKRVPRALGNAGFACFDKGDAAGAVKYISRVLERFPNNKRSEDLLLTLAQAHEQLKQYPQARAAYARLLQLAPEGRYAFDAQSGIAWCDHTAGRLLDAARGFARAARLAGKDKERALEAHYNAGAVFREAKRIDDAIRELAFVGEAKGHRLQGQALFRMGAFRLEQGKTLDAAIKQARARGEHAQAADLRKQRTALTREAVGYIERALKLGNLGADAPEAATFLGEAYLDLRAYPAAARVFGQVAQTWPKDERAPWALYHMALALREQARILERQAKREQARSLVQEAKEALKKVFVFHPKSRLRLQAAYAMADYQAQLGAVDKSRAAYKWVAESGPAWAAAWRDARGKPAPELVERATEFAADSLFRLGESYYPDQNPAKAAEFYGRVVSQYPKSSQAAMSMLRLGEIAEARKDHARAVERYRAVLERGKTCPAYPNALFDLGVLQLVQGQTGKSPKLLGQALSNLEAFLRDFPGHSLQAKAQYYRAEALYAAGRRQEACGAYRKSLAQAPRGEFADKAIFGLAWCEHELAAAASDKQSAVRWATAARADFSRLVKEFGKSPLRPDAIYMLCLGAYEDKDFPAALAHAATLARDYPKSDAAARALIVRAKALDGLGKHREAADAFNRFLQAYPDHTEKARALYGLSWAWWNLAKPEFRAARAAEKKYRAAAEKDDPASKHLRRLWQDKLTAARKFEDRMAAALQRLLAAAPDFELRDEACLRLGEVAYDRKRYEHAAALYRRALEAAKKRGGDSIADKALYRLGWCWLRRAEQSRLSAATAKARTKRAALLEEARKREAESLRYFERLAKDFPKSEFAGEGYFRAAELRRKAGDYQGAIAGYQRAMRRDPKAAFTPAAAYGIGACHLGLKRYREALRDFTTLLDAFPKTRLQADACWGAGQACLELKAYKDAGQYFNRALRADDTSEAAAKARFGLGVIAMQQGRLEQAREEFLKVHAFHSAWPERAALALLKASVVARRLKQPDKAKKDLEVLQKRYPFTAAARQVKAAGRQGR